MKVAFSEGGVEVPVTMGMAASQSVMLSNILPLSTETYLLSNKLVHGLEETLIVLFITFT